MKDKKLEENIGYILLVIGLIFIVLPVVLSCLMLFDIMAVPELVPVITIENLEETIMVFSNVCLIVLLLIIIVWAGSIITSRGLSLIKKMELKVTSEEVSEKVNEKVKAVKKRKENES